jgi:hypothetical protein
MTTIRDEVKEHLRQLITVLVGFVIAGFVALVPPVPKWSSVIAAIALLIALVLLARWLSDSPVVWRQHFVRRGVLIGGPLAAAVGVLVLGGLFGTDSGRFRSLSNVEIILDRSAGMAAKLGGSSRASVAAEKVSSFVDLRDDSAFALRAFGGACRSVPEQLVDFDTDSAGEVKERAGQLEPRGKANLVDAIVAAASDFNDPSLYPEDVAPDSLQNRIVVITGSSDACGGDLTGLDTELRDSPAGITLDYTFIGFDVGDEEARDELRQLATKVGADAVFAETADDLERVLDGLAYDAYLGEINGLTDLVNDVRGFVFGGDGVEGAYVEAAEALGSGANFSTKVKRLRTRIEQALAEMERTEPLFQALRKPHGPDEYQALWDIDVAQRDLLREEIERMDELTSILESDHKTFRDGGRATELWENFQHEQGPFVDRNDEFEQKADLFLGSLSPR